MNAFLSLGRWFFAIPFAIFGLFHFINAEAMAQMVPNYFPAMAKTVLVYFTGMGLVAASISIVSGKFDKLACVLLAIFLLSMIILMHFNAAMNGPNEMVKTWNMNMLLKDISLAGAAMMYAQYQATDRSIIG
jgi:putative oxidoreductase